MRIFNNYDATQTSQYIQHDWPQMITNTTGTHNNYEYMGEYICIRCSISLQWSKPKMPDQACANNLNLDDIPQDLTELLTIERGHIIQTTIYDFNSYEKVWRTLQSKWTTCEYTCKI